MLTFAAVKEFCEVLVLADLVKEGSLYKIDIVLLYRTPVVF